MINDTSNENTVNFGMFLLWFELLTLQYVKLAFKNSSVVFKTFYGKLSSISA